MTQAATEVKTTTRAPSQAMPHAMMETTTTKMDSLMPMTPAVKMETISTRPIYKQTATTGWTMTPTDGLMMPILTV